MDSPSHVTINGTQQYGIDMECGLVIWKADNVFAVICKFCKKCFVKFEEFEFHTRNLHKKSTSTLSNDTLQKKIKEEPEELSDCPFEAILIKNEDNVRDESNEYEIHQDHGNTISEGNNRLVTVTNEECSQLMEHSIASNDQTKAKKRKMEQTETSSIEINQLNQSSSENNLLYIIYNKLLDLEKTAQSNGDFITELTTEVCLLKSNLNMNDVVSNLFGSLPKLPISCIENLNEFERDLQTNTSMKNQLKSFYLRAGCEDIGSFVRTNIKKIITDEVIKENFTWKGTKEKRSMKHLIFIDLLKEAVCLKFSEATDKNIESNIQNYILHAGDRINKKMK